MPAPSIHHCCSNHLQQHSPRAINGRRESLRLSISRMQHDRRNYPPRARVVHQSRSSTPHSRPKTRHIRLLWSRRSTNRTIRSLGGRGRNFGRATWRGSDWATALGTRCSEGQTCLGIFEIPPHWWRSSVRCWQGGYQKACGYVWQNNFVSR